MGKLPRLHAQGAWGATRVKAASQPCEERGWDMSPRGRPCYVSRVLLANWRSRSKNLEVFPFLPGLQFLEFILVTSNLEVETLGRQR
jgi:hypothetical protein